MRVTVALIFILVVCQLLLTRLETCVEEALKRRGVILLVRHRIIFSISFWLRATFLLCCILLLFFCESRSFIYPVLFDQVFELVRLRLFFPILRLSLPFLANCSGKVLRLSSVNCCSIVYRFVTSHLKLRLEVLHCLRLQ